MAEPLLGQPLQVQLKPFPIEEFWRLGLLDEVNRKVLFDLGLALAVNAEGMIAGPDGQPMKLTGRVALHVVQTDPAVPMAEPPSPARRKAFAEFVGQRLKEVTR